MTLADYLRDVSLFVGLTDDELQAITGCLGRRTFGKGVFVFHKGSPGQVMYIIQSGGVRIFSVSAMGQELTVTVYGPGDFFGELSILDGLPRSAGAVALETTLTLTLRREDLLRHLANQPRLAFNLLQNLALRLRYTCAYAEDMAFLDANSRVAKRLLELEDRSGGSGTGVENGLYLTQAELGSWVAASRETVNRALQTLRSQGLIHLQDGRITIVDHRGLEHRVFH
jgi:CRP-like cAMP-binding protein